jgi:hypothetical protein
MFRGTMGLMKEPSPLTIAVSDSVRILEESKLRGYQGDFKTGERVSRIKISSKTKRTTHEAHRIDRSHPRYTVKYHRVQEFDQDGNPVGEPHEHARWSPAKRRRS